uniref:Uncharacterized protein n=1 Tax=Pipistrellus kuhlii TaxID=59472 RepID=A0A7J7V0L9_PIPKU|nr:hypothetical protein mPipKuh1_008635 [Pipistrellus kuhlii]
MQDVRWEQGAEHCGGRLGPCPPEEGLAFWGGGWLWLWRFREGVPPTLLVSLPSQPPRGLYTVHNSSRPRSSRPPGSEPAIPRQTPVGDFYVLFLFSILYRGILFPSLWTEVTFLVLLLTCSFF